MKCKYCNYLLTIALSILISGCSTTATQLKSDSVAKDTRLANGPTMIKVSRADEGKALIYVYYRTARIKTFATTPAKLYLNGHYVTKMRENGFYPIHITPGKVVLTLHENNIVGDSKFKLEGVMDPNQTIGVSLARCEDEFCFYNDISFPRETIRQFKGPLKTYGSGWMANELKLSVDREVDVSYLIAPRIEKKNKIEKINKLDNNRKTIAPHVVDSTFQGINIALENSESIAKGGIAGLGVGIGATIVAKVIQRMVNTEGDLDDDYVYRGVKGYYTDEHLK